MKGSGIDFLGRGWAFPPAFETTAATVQMVEAEDDIRQSLEILFSTIPGERIMLPDYGCNLNLYVFETLDETSLTHLRTVIADAIVRFEPRIILEDVSFDIGQIVDGVLIIRIDYLVEMTNSRSNLVFPYYLSEGTLVHIT